MRTEIPTKDIQIKTRMLELVKIGLSYAMPERNYEVSFREKEMFCNQMILDIRAYIFKESLGHKEIKYPADWIEAFKERWFPKSHPIRYKTFKFNLDALYPTIEKPLEEYLTTLKLGMIESCDTPERSLNDYIFEGDE